MIAEIRKLNPKPGLAFGSTMVQPIVPDVFVRPAPDGTLAGRAQFRHAAESAHQPALLRASVEDHAQRQGQEPISPIACRPRPGWCARSISAPRPFSRCRARSCASRTPSSPTACSILRPLNLKTVADAIGMHESTVSRVTANKYMATSRGIFELKYFFTSSIASADGGEAHSAEAVRHRIRQLIDAESAEDVLSDDTIVEKLRDAGIDIARRTVAKYREAMRIPSSVQRRREKQAASA